MSHRRITNSRIASKSSSSRSGSRPTESGSAVKRTPARMLALVVGISAALMVGVLFVQAANQTWDGGGTGNGTAWFTAANWVGDAGFPGSQSVTTNTDIGTI